MSMTRLRGLLAVVHPFPSALNASLVFGLSVVAGLTPEGAFSLALGMLGLQFAIGAANDYVDASADARSKPDKPIPAGLISRRTALVVAVVSAGGGLLLASLSSRGTLALAAAILAIGIGYDVWLKRAGLGWLAFAVAFPLLPVYAWYGATLSLPPRPELLFPVAVMAGPALQLANGLVDLERDATTGTGGLSGRLGRERAWLVMAGLQLAIQSLAWLTLLVASSPLTFATLVLLLAASAVTATGLVLSAHDSTRRREWGWRCQATGVAGLALAWLAAIPVDRVGNFA